MPAYRNSRYGRYRGGPDPLAPPPDISQALQAIGRDVMEGYSPQDALREHLRRGGRGQRGLDDLSRRVHQRRRELLSRHSLGGPLDEVRQLLDTALRLEREQFLRDARMDPTDRQLREMQLDGLPSSTAAAVNELGDYDWQSQRAREAFEQIRDKLGREVLDQRFAGMKQALEGATDEDREQISRMLGDLNDLLAEHARGEDTDEDFRRFMDEHGEHFPENPGSVDELIDAMAKRSAAAARMMNSMTPEQRQELMELSAQAFGSPQLMDQLSRLDSHLQALRPGEDWTGSERFEGQEGLGLGDGTGALQDIADLDALADQLSQSHQGAALDDIDLEALGRQLGDDAAVDARTLSGLERAMRESGMLQRGTDGTLRLSPRAVRQLGRSLLRDTARQLSGRSGARDTRRTGASGEATGSTRQWQFGDMEPWDVTRTITNAVQRTVGEGGDPSGGVRLRVEDVEVQETEDRTQAAVALLVDTSFSMAAEGRWLPMKQTALALHHLISTRFRGDSLELISFGRWARSLDENELTALPPVHEQGTNLHHGLLLAARFFRKHPSMQPVLLVVTDGEPTAHLLPSGDAHFDWPTSAPTLHATVSELDRVTRTGAQTTFFQLGDDPGLTRFLNAMARRADGRVVTVDPDDLGSAVLDEYLSAKGADD